MNNTHREHLLGQVDAYRAQGLSLPLDLWSALLVAGIDPNTVQEEPPYAALEEECRGIERDQA